MRIAHPEFGRSEQITSQFLLKSLHIILESRIPSLRPNAHSGDLRSVTRVRKNDKWFNLALRDRPAALENLDFWHRNVMDPMIIDIILVHESLESEENGDLLTSSGERSSVETVIERWVVQYEPPLRTMVPQPSEGSLSCKRTYKKSIILLRSLYSTLRFLSAYKIFRKLSRPSQTYNFDIIYKVSSFSEPFSRVEEQAMKVYSFVPVEAYPGQLSISVTYRPTLTDFNLELSTSLPPQIITEYVGSPATDPLKAPTSAEDCATSFPLRGIHSPKSTQFEHPHSWTSGNHRAAPFTQNYALSGSPPACRTTPTFFDNSPDIYNYRTQSYGVPAHNKGPSFDEYQFSPPLPSPSPSPPTRFPTSSLQTRLCSESAQVNSSDPNRHALPPMSPKNSKPDLLSQEYPSGSKSFRRTEGLRAGDLHGVIANLNLYSGQKVFKDSKDDSGRFSGPVSSNSSPRHGFSRSSSRLSFQDDLDNNEFSCPFAVDDVNTSAFQTRTSDGKEASETISRKSQDSAIGVLVHMLRTAPPLRQDQSCCSSQSTKTKFEGDVGTASDFLMPRKTEDALKELRSYREMKDSLLSQSGTRLSSEDQASSASFAG